jgi:hypothetical protein
MSTVAKVTAVLFLWGCSLVFVYGKGQQHGRQTQMTLKQVLEVCEIQYVAIMREIRKDMK